MTKELRYDPNRLGFLGDAERLEKMTTIQAQEALDRWYWRIIERIMNDDIRSPYTLDYLKKNMEFASHASVGVHRALARADERAWQEITLRLSR